MSVRFDAKWALLHISLWDRDSEPSGLEHVAAASKNRIPPRAAPGSDASREERGEQDEVEQEREHEKERRESPEEQLWRKAARRRGLWRKNGASALAIFL